VNAGALHADLLNHGRHPDQIGSRWFSWYDFQVFVDHLPQDSTSALYRALRPDDHIWSDPKNVLLAKMTTAVTQIRWMQAVTKLEQVPPGWEPESYGPHIEPEAPTENRDVAASIAKARSVAAEIRGELAA
jgi:hypothetical protein